MYNRTYIGGAVLTRRLAVKAVHDLAVNYPDTEGVAVTECLGGDDLVPRFGVSFRFSFFVQFEINISAKTLVVRVDEATQLFTAVFGAAKFEDEVPSLFKALGYKFTIGKAALQTVGASHTWPLDAIPRGRHPPPGRRCAPPPAEPERAPRLRHAPARRAAGPRPARGPAPHAPARPCQAPASARPAPDVHESK